MDQGRDGFFIVADGKSMGPFSEEQIRQMILAGLVGRKTLVWRDGFSEWVNAESISEWYGLFSEPYEKSGQTENSGSEADGSSGSPNISAGFIRSFRSKDRIIGAVGEILSIVGLFLPYFYVQLLGSRMNIAFFDFDEGLTGLFFLIVIIVTVLFYFLPYRKMYLISVLILMGLEMLIFVLLRIRFNDSEYDLSAFVSNGIGFYSMTCGVILLLVSAMIRLKSEKN